MNGKKGGSVHLSSGGREEREKIATEKKKNKGEFHCLRPRGGNTPDEEERRARSVRGRKSSLRPLRRREPTTKGTVSNEEKEKKENWQLRHLGDRKELPLLPRKTKREARPLSRLLA